MQEADKRSYPELEDTIVVYVDTTFAPVRQEICRVIGCDFHIGVTLVEEADHEHYVMCAHGPLSPFERKSYEDDPEDLIQWEVEFEVAIAQLKMGYFDVEKVARAANPSLSATPGASKDTCALGA